MSVAFNHFTINKPVEKTQAVTCVLFGFFMPIAYAGQGAVYFLLLYEDIEGDLFIEFKAVLALKA